MPKFKYIGTEEQLKECEFKIWRGIFMIRKIEDTMYVHIAQNNGYIQRGDHNINNDYIGDAIGFPIQKQDIQDLIDKGLVIQDA